MNKGNPIASPLRAMAILLALVPACAHAQQVRITSLDDVNFGTIVNLSTDQVMSQNVCIYSSGFQGGYRITATGSGAGGDFTLSSGSNLLRYELQWADSANQTSGTSLSPGVPLTGQNANAFLNTCFFGFFPTASLITILRSSETSQATAGSYTGTVWLLVAPN